MWNRIPRQMWDRFPPEIKCATFVGNGYRETCQDDMHMMDGEAWLHGLCPHAYAVIGDIGAPTPSNLQANSHPCRSHPASGGMNSAAPLMSGQGALPSFLGRPSRALGMTCYRRGPLLSFSRPRARYYTSVGDSRDTPDPAQCTGRSISIWMKGAPMP